MRDERGVAHFRFGLLPLSMEISVDFWRKFAVVVVAVDVVVVMRAALAFACKFIQRANPLCAML